MKHKSSFLPCGLAALIAAAAPSVDAHSIIVDLDPITPGFQTAVAVLPGAAITADIHLVSDGATPLTGYALAVNFNDTPGVLALASPTIAGPVAGAIAAPIDLGGGGAAPPGAPLTPVGAPPFGVGPGGPFTASDGGAGIWDLAGIGFPIPPAGATLLLESVVFTAIGPVGSSSDIAPLGIVAPGAPPGLGAPPAPVVPGFEFYDTGGIGSYPAAGFAPGALPAFPGGLPPVAPGTVLIVPEPSAALLSIAGLTAFVFRRKRR